MDYRGAHEFVKKTRRPNDSTALRVCELHQGTESQPVCTVPADLGILRAQLGKKTLFVIVGNVFTLTLIHLSVKDDIIHMCTT